MLTKLSNNSIYFKQPGYSLIEVIIAIAVIVTGIFSVLTLTVSSLSATGDALDYLVAVNLAREGIELVRNRRDTNWYLNLAFDNGLTGDQTAVINYDDSNFDFGPDNIDNPGCQLKRSGSLYTHNIGIDTDHYRLITFRNICRHNTTGVEQIRDSCTGSQTKIGIDVVSEVKWTKDHISKTIQLNNRVYNWR